MTIWLFIWFILSATLLYFLVWNLFILFRQKKAWKAFAAAKSLRYKHGTILGSADVSGLIDGYTVAVFTGEYFPPDARSSRKMTAVEVTLNSRLPFEAGLASGGMIEILKLLGLKEEVAPADGPWDKSWIAVSADPAGFEAYLTRPRLEILAPLMKMKNGWLILVFRDDVSLLRIDTVDPLDGRDKLERLTAKMIEVAKMLELSEGEDRALKEAAARRPKREARIDPGKTIAQPVSLELEDEPSQKTSPDDATKKP